MTDRLHTDPANWTRGPIKLYFNRDDRRFVVPKYRPEFGWTINFAHPAAPVVMIAVLLAPVLWVAFGHG